jgi:hypothetical protein
VAVLGEASSPKSIVITDLSPDVDETLRVYTNADAALSPARELIESAVEMMIGTARRAKGDEPPAVPAAVVTELRKAVAITAAVLSPRPPDCSGVIREEFLVRLLLRLDDLETDGVQELMIATRTSLDAAWARMQ